MKNILSIAILVCLLVSCKNEKSKTSTDSNTVVEPIKELPLSQKNEILYVTAKSGLTIRETPSLKGQKLGKYKYGEQVEVLERTDIELSIVDNGAQTLGTWYKVKLGEKTEGYVFGGFLAKNNPSLIIEKVDGYDLTLSRVTKKDFLAAANNATLDIQDSQKCKADGKLVIVNEKEFRVKIADGAFVSKNAGNNETFNGYTYNDFRYFPELNIYTVKYAEIEGGGSLKIDAKTGRNIEGIGNNFAATPSKKRFATFAQDLSDAGWLPNGLSVYDVVDGTVVNLFNFNPQDAGWGPSGLVWQDENTIIFKFETTKAPDYSRYKKLTFQKQ